MHNNEQAVNEEKNTNKIKIYEDIAAGQGQNMMQLLRDLQSLHRGGPTTLITAAQMIYSGIEEYIESTIYHTNSITIENLKEALAEPTPEDTIHYLQDWLKQYEERYEVVLREVIGDKDEKQE